MTTLVDLQMTADTSQLDKATESLKKTGEAAKSTATEGQKLADENRKVAISFESLEKAGGKVTGAMHDVAQSFNPVKLATAALTAGIAALSLDALKGMVLGVVSARAELYKLHETTGLAVETLSGLKGIAIQTGTSMDDIAALTIKFNQAVATSGRETSLQNSAFKNLGVELKDANGHFKDSITLQIDAAKALNQHADGIEKDAYYMAIWGKQAVQNKDYLKNLGEQTEIHGKLTEEQAKKAHDLEIQMALLSKATGELKGQIADALIPTLLSLVGGFNEVTKAAGGMNTALNPKNIDILWMSQSKYTEEIRKTREEIDNLGKSGKWYNLGAKDSQEFVDAQRQVLEQRLKTLQNLQGKIDEAAEKARDSFRKAEHGGDAAKPVLTNLKDKEVPGGHEVPTPADSGYAAANKREEDTLIKLRAAYEALYGVQKNVHTLELQAAIDAGEFNAKYNKKHELIKQAASASELAALKQKAADADALEGINKRAKAENDAWIAAQRVVKAEQDKVTAMRQTVAEQNIARDVMKTFGKTQDDVNIAISDYNIAMAETALAIAKASGAEEQEVYQLQAKLDALKQIKDLQLDQKQSNDDEVKRQRTFSAGWTKAFKEYEDNATNSAKTAGTIFNSVTDKMGSALSTFVTTGKLNFKELAASIIADLARIAAEKAIAGMIGSMFGDGGAFSGGSQFFADGAVVSTPTSFGMANGKQGVMGEAGPEAIMPLKRGTDGKLGVAVSGGNQGGAATTVIHNDMTVSIGSVDSNERKEELLKAIKQMIVSGTKETMSNEMRQGGMLSRRVNA